MMISGEIEKKYMVFRKTLENLETVKNIKEPYTVISRTGIVGLFNVCSDCAYIFVKNFLMFQGYFLPVTAFPQTIVKAAKQCGVIDDEELWIDILDTRNAMSRIYDEETAMKNIAKIKESFIPAFEKLDRCIADNWVEKE
ncbi:MAG: nucleotidyltransferase substrate binding protein [Oscillospiraceae bacterium]|nr:nucleotidyltransferase substrate binding protein [Oscillospiraceae bacterium]